MDSPFALIVCTSRVHLKCFEEKTSRLPPPFSPLLSVASQVPFTFESYDLMSFRQVRGVVAYHNSVGTRGLEQPCNLSCRFDGVCAFFFLTHSLRPPASSFLSLLRAEPRESSTCPPFSTRSSKLRSKNSPRLRTSLFQKFILFGLRSAASGRGSCAQLH